MNKQLKPCPFCGGKVSIATMGDKENEYYLIHSGPGKKICGCRLFMESEQFPAGSFGGKEYDELIERWNRRTEVANRD